MDGSRTIHGVERTYPGQVVGQYIKGNFNRIEYQGNDTWYGLRQVDPVRFSKQCHGPWLMVHESWIYKISSVTI